MASLQLAASAATARSARHFVAPPRRATRTTELGAQVERLLERMHIAVIYGGDGSTGGAVINQTINPRSWKSYQAVAEDIAAALGRLGARHVCLIPDDMHLGDRLRREGVHMAWLNTGGVQGYHAMCHSAAMLEMFGIPYVGHDPLTAVTLDNKHAFKRALTSLDIPTAPFMTWDLARGPFWPEVNDRYLHVFRDYDGPFVVKPVTGRASLHVHFVDDVDELTEAVAEVYHATENLVLIESYLPGREFCVAVCGAITAQGGRLVRRNDPFVFAAIERTLGADERIFTSMDVRPITAERFRTLDPVGDAAELAELRDLAHSVFLEMELESIIRLDVRADAAGKMAILEANPKPDLKTPTKEVTSLVCAGLADHGMDYDDLILSLLADRIDLLFGQRRSTVMHLTALLD